MEVPAHPLRFLAALCPRGRRRSRPLGFVLVAFALALLLILGTVGLAFDLGRMYIVRNESQSFCDSAALAAAWQLDGSVARIQAARAAAFATQKQYQFGTTAFDPNNVVVEFAQDPPTSWDPNPADPTNYVLARVTTTASLPMMFMPVLTGAFSSTIRATATAKQIPAGGLPPAIFPFAPLWLPSGSGTVPPDSVAPTDPFNMVPAQYKDAAGNTVYQHGGVYTLRGPSALKDPVEDLCPNDATASAFDYRADSGAPDRGFLWDSKSTADIKASILGNGTPDPSSAIEPGDSVYDPCSFCKDPGVREATVKAIMDRVKSDTDSTTRWYADYIQAINNKTGTYGNYIRVVAVPVATGVCSTNGGCPSPYGDNTVVGFAAFFLLPPQKRNSGPYGVPPAYYGSGNAPICAEYIGPWNGGGGAAAGPYGSMRIAKLVQ